MSNQKKDIYLFYVLIFLFFHLQFLLHLKCNRYFINKIIKKNMTWNDKNIKQYIHFSLSLLINSKKINTLARNSHIVISDQLKLYSVYKKSNAIKILYNCKTFHILMRENITTFHVIKCLCFFVSLFFSPFPLLFFFPFSSSDTHAYTHFLEM